MDNFSDNLHNPNFALLAEAPAPNEPPPYHSPVSPDWSLKLHRSSSDDINSAGFHKKCTAHSYEFEFLDKSFTFSKIILSRKFELSNISLQLITKEPLPKYLSCLPLCFKIQDPDNLQLSIKRAHKALELIFQTRHHNGLDNFFSSSQTLDNYSINPAFPGHILYHTSPNSPSGYKQAFFGFEIPADSTNIIPLFFDLIEQQLELFPKGFVSALQIEISQLLKLVPYELEGPRAPRYRA